MLHCNRKEGDAMLTQERHEAILKILSEKGSVSVAELTKTLGVSESTVRRDLILLSNSGNLKKIHGGATLTKKQFISGEDTVSDKSEKNIDEKRRIAKYAASQINSSDFVYLDAGTTTLFMIDYLPEGIKANFVTNGITHAKALSKKGFSPQYGARPIAGVIRTYLKKTVSRLIVSEEIKPGDHIIVNFRNNELAWELR